MSVVVIQGPTNPIVSAVAPAPTVAPGKVALLGVFHWDAQTNAAAVEVGRGRVVAIVLTVGQINALKSIVQAAIETDQGWAPGSSSITTAPTPP